MSRMMTLVVDDIDVAIFNSAADLTVIGMDLVNNNNEAYDFDTNLALGTMCERLRGLARMVSEELGLETVDEVNRKLTDAVEEAAEVEAGVCERWMV